MPLSVVEIASSLEVRHLDDDEAEYGYNMRLILGDNVTKQLKGI